MTDRVAAIVVDASALTKVVLIEPQRDEVISALRRAAAAGLPMLVLPHTRYEVGNAFVRAARPVRRKPEEVDRDLLDALALVEVADDPPAVAVEAMRHDLTYYDAAYVALARATPAARLWTYDRRLGAAAERAGIRIAASAIAPA